ncbi:hypothetical protein HQ576_09310, partial [bacterium]|nr:hypothetical protein [bacterium]
MSRRLATLAVVALTLFVGSALPTLAGPIPPTADLVVHLVADEGITYSTTNPALVAEWHDQATALGGDNFAQVNTDTRRPTLVPNALGGHDVIRFDGTDDLLCLDGTWSAMDGDEATWFVVAQSDFTTEQSLVRMNTSTNAALYGSLTKNTNGGEFISHARTSAGGWVGANSTGAATSDYFVM